MKNSTIDLPGQSINLSLDDYRFDENSQCWLPNRNRFHFSYSDGDEVEQRIAGLIKQANNITVLSTELRQYCIDWPSLYHLTSARANILRPFEADLRGDILEIGAGCGAITRYLGECGGNVLALEGSPRRAAIAKSRTRDLPNVAVVVDDFNQFQCAQKFDVITLIGVLEYANLFSNHDDPALSMLQRAQSLLKPSGKLIIAIENQLGLKYFAGAPEDHLGKSMYGIEARYRNGQPQTFGKVVLKRMLKDAGFESVEFLAPFPDYKLPVSILTEQGMNNQAFDAATLAWQSVRRDPQLPVHTSFALELAWPEIFKNGLAMDMANSFLIVASISSRESNRPNILAFHYTTERRPQFCKETRFIEKESGDIIVQYRRLASNADHRGPTSSGELYFSVPDSSAYISGKLLLREFIETISRTGWSISEVGFFLKRYIRAIRSVASLRSIDLDKESSKANLPGYFIDLLPQNIIVKHNGGFEHFDLEWESADTITLDFLLFRGLFVALGNTSQCAIPNDGRLIEWKTFIQKAVKTCGLDISDEQYSVHLLKELELRKFVTGISIERPDIYLNCKLPAFELETALISRDAEVARYNAEIESARAEIESARAEIESARARIRALEEEKRNNSTELNQLKLVRESLDNRVHYLEYREVELTRWVNDLLASLSWKITSPLRSTANIRNWMDLRIHDVKDAYNKGGIINVIHHTWIYSCDKLLSKKLASLLTFEHGKSIIGASNDQQSLDVQSPVVDNVAPQSAAQSALASFDVICFANIEWSARYQRPQHIMSQFAKNGYRVFYIIASKLPPSNTAYMVEKVAEHVYEVCLRVGLTQNFYGEMMEYRNKIDFLESLAELMKDYRIKTALSVVHIPYWTPLALELRARYDWKILYDCMDEWVDFPNIGKALIDQEEILVRQSDLVTVTASLLYEKWSSVAQRCVLIRNAVDYVFFREYCSPNRLLEDITHPIIGYYGALAEWVDFELLSFLAQSRPDWSFVLIGDIFVKDTAGLAKIFNVYMPGRQPYLDMPKFLYHFDVCLIPFKLNNVTHAVDPVKFYEFISAGKPIVSVPLEELKIYSDYIYFASQPEQFLRKIEMALGEIDPDLFNRRVELAQRNDWTSRFEAFSSAIIALYEKVSIIVITYNNCDLTRLCIESIFRNTTYPRYEVIIVDNASSDDTRNYLRYLARTSDRVKIILNSQNLGFAVANNQGLKVATGEYIVLLNNDTVMPRGWLDPLLLHLKDPNIGLVGPVTNFVGNEAKVDVDYSSLDEMESFADRYIYTHSGKIFDIAVLAMFCVAMRRSVFECVGFLDENFGIGMFEDDDYSNRVREKGFRVVCAEDAFVHHFGQAAFKKLIETGEYQRIWANNQAYYEKKWGQWKPHAHR
ncbi:MAG: glycosyltransferase [Candidatus Contendobacter sp.]|nr:glycosyltransferase [Candidatus Contendobacter sp.]